jgi:hypothetical protein
MLLPGLLRGIGRGFLLFLEWRAHGISSLGYVGMGSKGLYSDYINPTASLSTGFECY